MRYIEYKFLELFAEKCSEKTYTGHGDYEIRDYYKLWKWEFEK